MIAIGQTEPLFGGTIERQSDTRFLVTLPDGKRRSSSQAIHRAEVAYRWCENRLRRAAGLPALPALCAYCGEQPRRTANPYCSQACRAKVREQRVRRRSQTLDAPVKSTEEVLGILHRIAPEPEPRARDLMLPLPGLGRQYEAAAVFRTAREHADALIRARGGIVPRSQGTPLTVEQVRAMRARVEAPERVTA